MGSVFSLWGEVIILDSFDVTGKLFSVSSSSEKSLHLAGTVFVLANKGTQFLTFMVERGFVGVGLVALGTIVGSRFI